uniref:RING-type domain-containing protein n=1 Tax=Chromera velia CCMP2878 TaxID=1169474 RepID=A0A0G4GME0_9ALVE|mmetsp:Transcript_5030/g.10059  ORF Transcript_5030/g.10059 Transcript_5030/m.10059 type:complete len:494 (+) Transcript_5030:275-1756(+)|eukprot:Cvel_22522.t1-p1 / transcript=Cvel_22522.t1 / gene=Cvel_22522 / organism=Chromera_velia_CCMP2878 / gene_product=Bardet-Biedl syndrome 5 protein homolog, putative / transcript_product=Bardet-Biedl syndrome 5 protein homolog, putative / location=Cvel_scaffold2221:19218-26498(+) / protein_length=493 / sequence_SO=supercontig / SO=protein_coding / is_pseudo=false
MGNCLQSPEDEDARQLWQDRQICWDRPKKAIALRPGEVLHNTFEKVEDTKGDNAMGKLSVTNLRIIWVSDTTPKINISIGLGNVVYLHFNMANTKAYQRTRAPNIMTQYNNTRFEFTFASPPAESMNMFSMLDMTIKRYRATRAFRDLILRDENLLTNGEVNLLYEEELQKKYTSCDNLTSDESFPGTFFITNFRLVWSSRDTPNINVSVPFLQTKSIGSRYSRFGTALVLETCTLSGGYILGFKFATTAEFQAVSDLLNKLLTASRQKPWFGPPTARVQVMNDRLVIVPDGQEEVAEEEEGDETRRLAEQNGIRLTPVAAGGEERPAFPVDTSGAMDASAISAGPAAAAAAEEDGGAGAVALPGSASAAPEEPSQPQTAGAAEAPRLTLPIGHDPHNVVAGRRSRDETLDLRRMGEKEHPVAENAGGMSPQSRKYHSRAPNCVICLTRRDDVAFDPCGHVCCCHQCAESLAQKLCPICRKPIEKMLRIFITR